MNRLYIFFCLFLLISCNKNEKLFSLIPSDQSGITFSNNIQENDSLNVLDVQNIYNGGGVGVGDFNNDGLQDIYFTGNTVSNKLYLNKGNFKFEDITNAAGVSGEGKWSRGVSVVDINNDGLLDMYVCTTLSTDVRKRVNILYINTGIDSMGIPHFKDMAAEYGLADTAHSTMAAFFDYDNDGDLDMYLLVNEIEKGKFPGAFHPILKNRENPSTDKLFRNDWNDSLKHPIFTEVSKAAGINIEGYSHGINIVDINMDGWKDVYVTNDFILPNILYINNHDGTFTNRSDTYFKHTSESSMGQDVIDINNDGLADVIELDMNPEDNYRKKTMMNALNYRRYQNNEEYGYQHQYVRNVLQINQGPRVLQNDSVGPPIFSDIAFFSGIAETDWSWTPSVADYDNDGYRDIIITNGFPKDVTDHDFGMFRNRASSLVSKKELLEQIPQVKISNYAYKNNGDLTFKNVTAEWGIRQPSFSNGAAYVDLDNDGDLDYVVNNINDKAFIYRNNTNEISKENNYLQVKFAGDSLNKNGLGAFIEMHYKGKQQVLENTPYRGYLSSISPVAQFGLGNVSIVDSIIIKWPNGKMQLMQNVKTNQLITVDIKKATSLFSFTTKLITENPLFTDVTNLVNINYTQKERDYIDFNVQNLLPHKLSEYGPALAVGDINGDGLDDMVSGGSFFFDTKLFLQQKNGTFISKTLLNKGDSLPGKNNEDLGMVLFDADNDGDLDIYIASGGYEFEHNTPAYTDRLYINDGKGNFHRDSLALPQNFTSKSCVRVADFDNDGDMDLFIAGRVDPWNYPRPVSSFIYRNDSKNGVIKFTDVTATIAPALINLGLACDAVWTDFDNDGWPDLIVAGEWMPLKFFKNDKGKFTDISATTGLNKELGWWTSIVSGDFDNDGDMDYIVGNLGKNSFYRASHDYPVNIYAKDFDKNGKLDIITTAYLPDEKGIRREFPAQSRDDNVEQIPKLKKRFLAYKDFGRATITDIFSKEELNDALKLQANNFENSYIENLGNGKFKIKPLPAVAQFSCINGMVAEDFDLDGNLDIALVGNDYGTEVTTGRYDAFNGMVLKGNGNGNFQPLSILQSGLFVPGNAKAFVKLKSSAGNLLLAASQNRGPLKVFKLKKDASCISLNFNDVSAVITFKNGKKQTRENYGSSFLSESGKFIVVSDSMLSIEIKDNIGRKRLINLK